MADAAPITRLNAALEGRYRIERELGEGGMATVYLASDLRHDRIVALKVMKPELAAVLGNDRFLTEIKTTAKLQHPNILPLFDSGEANGLLFYVTPYLEGESLRDRLDRERQLPIDDVVRLASEMADALDYAHGRGVIHRDIKPSNVLLVEGRPVIADFGIALAVGEAGRSRLTETGMSLGTPHYMSPEQAAGDASVDRRTDVYALGCVVYEALAGHTPFADAATAAAVLGRAMTEDPLPVSRTRPSATGLDGTVARALARLPADRYSTAGELARALEAGRGGPDIVDGWGPQQAVASQSEVKPGRNRVIRGTIGAVAVVLVVAVGVIGLRNDQPPVGANVDRPALAVLNFDNLSPDPDDAYFAAGMHEELRTQLARIDGIRLIAAQPVLGGDSAQLAATEVARSLGASFLLSGSVRRAGNDVAITLRLQDLERGEEVWGETYQRDLADVFRVQGEVAARVIEELRGVLSPDERAQLADLSTPNAEALEWYLRGQANFRSYFREDRIRTAAFAYGRAVELDPDFVEAWSRLVIAQLYLAWLWGEPAERDNARRGLARLEELASGSDELRLARGAWLYWGELRLDEALSEMQILSERWPNETLVLFFRGALERRIGALERRPELVQAGVDSWLRLLEIDPTDAGIAYSLGTEFVRAGRFEEGRQYQRIGVTQAPDVAVHWYGLLNSSLAEGDTATARQVAAEALDAIGRENLERDGHWWNWRAATGDLAEVVERLAELYRSSPLEHDGTWWGNWDLGLVAASALGDARTVGLFAEELRRASALALAELDSTDERNRRRLLVMQTVAEAYLGNAELADDLEEQARELPATQPVVDIEHFALADLALGRLDEAVDHLRNWLSLRPGHAPGMAIDPRWIPLRDHRGFRALVE